MSRKKVVPPSRSVATAPPTKPLVKASLPFYKNPLYASLLLSFIAFGLYFNSIFNEYALDDVISITSNSFTKKGLGGIGDLINKDSFYGFIGNASELSGGRWRPLSLITFAFEWQFAPKNPHLSHLINVLLYALTAFVLFQFVYRFMFKNNLYASFATVFIFVIHPIHTEVIANIKSRDELLSFLLLMASLYFLMKYCVSKEKMSLLLLSVGCYFLALLSKENGLTFIAVIPMTLFVFANYTLRKSLMKSIPFVVVAGFYFLLRLSVIGFIHKSGGIQEVMNAPYLYATVVQSVATKMFVLGLYIKMLFVPYPLSYDYSFNQIRYVDFANAWVWISVVIQLALLAYALVNVLKRSVLAYGILFYFFSIFIVSNLLIDIGGIMGERFLYQPSFGFAIALVAGMQLLFNRLKVETKSRIAIGTALMVLLFIPSAIETVARNKDWKSDKTLFTMDVLTAPNSARTQNGAGTAYILLSDDFKSDTLKRQALLDSALLHLDKALVIHPNYIDPFLNIGVVYNRTNEIEKAEAAWNKARSLNGAHPKLKELDRVLASSYLIRGLKKGDKKQYNEALQDIRRSVHYNSEDGDAWYNLGGVYFTLQKLDSAVIAFDKSIMLNSKYKSDASNGLNAAISQLQIHNQPVPNVESLRR